MSKLVEFLKTNWSALTIAGAIIIAVIGALANLAQIADFFRGFSKKEKRSRQNLKNKKTKKSFINNLPPRGPFIGRGDSIKEFPGSG